MHYKTLCLQLLQERPELHDLLRKQRMLLPALDAHARNLKERHELWKEHLSQEEPGSDPNQIESEVLEIALKELEDSLPPVHPEDEEVLSLDPAMAFLTPPTRPA